jgi:glutathione S-transferase
LRFLVGLQKTGETPVTEFLRTRALRAFAIVEKHLGRQPFIVGDRPTIADISMVGYLFHPEETGIDRASFPNIDAWTGRIRALPGWAGPYDLMPRAFPG